ncbi:trafficking protein particle complex subunit 10 isoform X3 [Strongylocentrotus purpuratus]|uniref:Trafficking protein particle complex subunit 10 n=1 Tax=Strongylocentrotus purpuratus TaxID=7668 RepID=A0A7M7T373_STRPU|nr:trafficking protein particle complex subunit 10 isoform X3 [Strongylocentrotus purpuratus]
MENKPIVTCHGEQELFSSIHVELAQSLPREVVEWRRSYGRAPKMINVDVNFVPYNSDLLPTENDRKLLQLPVFHIYWTECPDADAYKMCVKNDISAWQQSLKECNVSDWLIVLVETSNPKRGNKQKFLPRTSVLDKIRNDFCSKQSDRVIVLHEPNNPVPTPRAQDSWQLFMQRLRYLVLLAYNRVLGRFEELIRAERESRNNKDWNFCQYFLLQEELAFMFETLRQFEDALVQYDELDALFSQFIINSSAGATPKWLSDFQAPCNCWDGLNLSKPVNMDKRELLERGKPTLLDVRNYLFSRQSALLFLLKRPSEVAYRAQNFMHNCVQELKILEVSMPQGSIACWVFLSCLEVLQKCEKSSDTAHINTYSHYTASLWLYAQKKLNELGELGGLMPDTSPTSEQLNSVVDLLSGMGQTAEVGARENSPNQMLREALSSQDSFSKHYLELSELAMGTFKHIGRMRSAKLIGKDLASFYMKTGELHKAESFLSDALKVYEAEGWGMMTASTRKELAGCYKKLDNNLKYLKLCCQLAADKFVDPDRMNYFKEINRVAAIDVPQTEEKEKALYLWDFIFAPPTLSLDPPNGRVGKEEVINIKVTFTSNLPAPITLHQITLQLHDQLSLASGGGESQPIRLEKSPSQDSLQRLRSLDARAQVSGREKGGVIPVFGSEVKFGEESRKLVETSSLVCTNANVILQRQDSSTSLKKNKDVVTKEMCSTTLVLQDIELKPGKNELEFKFQSAENGTFEAKQLICQIYNAEFLANLEQYCTEIEVFSKEAQLTITTESDLLCGIPQDITLHLTTGYTPIPESTTLAITTPTSLAILPSKSEEYEVESVDDGGKVRFVEGVKSNEEIDLRVGVVADMCRQSEGNKQNIQFSVECPWSETVMTTLEFTNPFTFKQRIYTAGQRKFLQVTVESSCDLTFELSGQSLEVTGDRLLTLTPLHPIKSIPLQGNQSVSYVWEAKPVPDTSQPAGPLGFHYSVSYRPIMPSPVTSQDQPLKSISCDFEIINFETLFMITSIIKPPKKEELCKAGTLCTLDVAIKMLDTPPPAATTPTPSGDTPTPSTKPNPPKSLMYEIDTEGGMWAVCGRSTGVVAMPSKQSGVTEVTLEVIPLIAGFLPMPDIRLSQYLKGVDPNEGSHPLAESSGEQAKKTISSSNTKPTILPFSESQVYYCSKACQIRVLPESNLSTVEVAVF